VILVTHCAVRGEDGPLMYLEWLVDLSTAAVSRVLLT